MERHSIQLTLDANVKEFVALCLTPSGPTAPVKKPRVISMKDLLSKSEPAKTETKVFFIQHVLSLSR